MYQPTLEEVRELAKSANLIPVYQDILADMETPVSAYLKIARGPYSFLLESVEGSERVARYSFIGTEPYRVFRTGLIQTEAAPLHEELVDLGQADPLIAIEQELRQFSPAPVTGLPRFHGGAVGYVSYEAVGYFEQLPKAKAPGLELPESVFLLTDTLVVFDHRLHKIQVVTHARVDGDVDLAYEQATQRIDTLVSRLNSPTPMSKIKGDKKKAAPQGSNMTQAHHRDMVDRAKRYIVDGDVIQTVLSQRLHRPTAAHSFDLYRAVRSINPSPYMFYLDLGGFQLVGASPEMLVRVEGRTISNNPIAGTRPRGETEEKDKAMEAELRQDLKERAEHIMLVDLGRNDVGRVSKPATVVVDQLMDVERYSHVMHLVSQVSGELKEGVSCYDAFRACFPAGTVSGAPKIRAMEIIAELEPDKRGPYAGAVGYFDFSGNMDTCIAIRTMIVKDGVAYVQAGGGIVYDSVPRTEFEETLHKAEGLMRSIDVAESMEQPMGHLKGGACVHPDEAADVSGTVPN